MKRAFTKRVFTARLFFSDLAFLLRNLPRLRSVFLQKELKTIIAKSAIVVGAINNCPNCMWLDAKLALHSGVGADEIKKLIKLEFQTSASDYELNALLFAQHYAETNRNPDPDLLKKLFDFYGQKSANDIILVIRVSLFGNLYFNTWEAAVNRWKGSPSPNSSVIFELFFFLFNSIVVLPVLILKKIGQKTNDSETNAGW